jgi:hypothetical protein
VGLANRLWKKQLATKTSTRGKLDTFVLGVDGVSKKTVGMTSPGQRCLESSCRWSMHQKRSGRALIDVCNDNNLLINQY